MGRPDYHIRTETDIILQTLGEIVSRNKYGSPNYAGGTFACPGPNILTDLFTVAGTGIIYRCSWYISSVNDHRGDDCRLRIDGVNLINTTFQVIYERGYVGYSNALVSVMDYDLVNLQYSMVNQREITFEAGVTLAYYNRLAFAVNVEYMLQYALI